MVKPHGTPLLPFSEPHGLDRRTFLIRAGCASAVAVAAVGLGFGLHDPAGPGPAQVQKALPGLGDFTLKDRAGPKMAIVRGTDRAAMVERGVAALGGMESFVHRGDRVLVKVNAAFATPAALGATTHPETLVAVAGLCFKAGAAQVLVTDNPINDPESCFGLSGLTAATRSAGARIVGPKAALFAPATVPGGRLITDWPVLAGPFKGVNKVVVVSPVKDHQRAGASMTLKNLYGLLGGRRNVFHQNINGIITELSQLLKPTLCVLDGTVCMMANGPTGGSLSDLKDVGVLAVSTDPVAADALGLELLGRSQTDVPYVLMAQAAGAGTADYQSLNPLRLDTKA